jgi:hypothetical protein
MLIPMMYLGIVGVKLAQIIPVTNVKIETINHLHFRESLSNFKLTLAKKKIFKNVELKNSVGVKISICKGLAP